MTYVSQYSIEYTNSSKSPITVRRKVLVNATDVKLIGKRYLEYGEVFNENCLHLLEHFSAPSATNSPEHSDTSGTLLNNPTIGQIWYNSTRAIPNVWDGYGWNPIRLAGNVAGNSGVIAHGEQLPRPVDTISGYVFPYDECSWTVSPFHYNDVINYLKCYTELDSTVVMEYRISGDTSETQGYVNYQIIGIRGNGNLGDNSIQPDPAATVTPTPTPTSTATNTPTPTATVTPSEGAPEPSASFTPTPTPTPTVTPSEGAPEPSASSTPTPTPAPTNVVLDPTPTNTQTPTPTPTQTPTLTPPPTPTVTPTQLVEQLSVQQTSGTFMRNTAACNALGDDCAYTTGLTTTSVSIQANGGVPPYTYSTSPVASSGSNIIDVEVIKSINATTLTIFTRFTGVNWPCCYHVYQDEVVVTAMDSIGNTVSSSVLIMIERT